MKTLIPNLLFFLASTLNVSSPTNFSIEDNEKVVNLENYEEKEVIEMDLELYIIEVAPFDIILEDYKNSDFIEIDFHIDKISTGFCAYHFYIVDENKNLVQTLNEEFLGVTDFDKDVTVRIYKEELKDIGNTYYLRIGCSDILEKPMELMYEYQDIPLSNTSNLVLEDGNNMEIIVEASYNGKKLTLTKEYFSILELQKNNEVDLYYKFNIDNTKVEFRSKDTYATYYMNCFLYIYDPLLLYNGAFRDDGKYEGYLKASCFFAATYDNISRTLGLTSIYYIDRSTFLMSSDRKQFTSYFRDNRAIYVPANFYEDYKDLKLILYFDGFGATDANIAYPFNVSFAPNFLDDSYYVKGEVGKKDWGGAMKEYEVWVVQLFSFPSCF